MSTVSLRYLAPALTVIALMQPCHGQNASELEKPDLPTAGKAGMVQSAVSSPGVQITATNDASNVALKFSTKPIAKNPIDSNQPGMSTWYSWSATAEAPLKKGEKRHDLLHQDGWGNSTALGVNYTYFFTPYTPRRQSDFDAYCSTLREKMFIEDKKKLPDSSNTADFAKLREEINARGCRMLDFMNYAPSLEEKARAARGGPARGGWLFGATAKLAFQNSEFYTPDTLTKQDEDHRPWSLALTGGWNPTLQPNLFLLVHAEHRRSYEEADEATRCPVENAGTIVTCVTGAFAPPALTKKQYRVVGGTLSVVKGRYCRHCVAQPAQGRDDR